MGCSKQAPLSSTVSLSLLRFMSIELATLSNHLILCTPTSPFDFSISQPQGLFQCIIPGGSAGKDSTCNVGDLGSIPGLGRSPGEGNSYPLQYSGEYWRIPWTFIASVFKLPLYIRWPKFWSFSFSISEYSGLISFRINWFDLLAIQGTLKSLFQHHNLKASVLQWTASLWSNPHIRTWWLGKKKHIALIIWTFVSKVISLLFNILSRFVTTFFPRSKRLFISWLLSPSAVISEAKKIKSDTVSTFTPSICHEMMGSDAMISVFWSWISSQLFHFLLSVLSRGYLVPIHFLPLEWYHLHI